MEQEHGQAYRQGRIHELDRQDDLPLAKRMPEFLTSDVLAQLTEAGILSSSIVKTLTLSTGHSKNVRLRSINRSFVNGYGRRDITTIST